MRTRNSIRNITAAIIGQIFGVLISFIARIIFVRILSTEYLGLSGLFTNLLTMLSLSELGIGTAITFSLYEPLAEKDINKISRLMHFYKKAYRMVGVGILIFGIFSIPIYPHFMNEVPDIPNLTLLYLLFIMNTVISYFYSYKRTLIICDQKRYIATFYRYLFYFFLNVSQIIILLTFKSYMLYVSAQFVFTWMENFFVSKKADQLYPYLREKKSLTIDEKEFQVIKKNIRAMFFHKIGALVIHSTDNILIAKFIGIAATGMYSNYQFVMQAVKMIISQISNSVVASIGNLYIEKNQEHITLIFNRLHFLIFWIYTWCCVGMYVLFQDFIGLFFGNLYLLEKSTVNLIIINFYIAGMRQPLSIFKEATGTYYHNRYMPIPEIILKLIISIGLVNRFGMSGIFMGTLVSTMTICFIVEPYVVYKYVLKKRMSNYYRQYFIYFAQFISSAMLMDKICSYFQEITISNLIYKLVICLLLPNILLLLCNYQKKEFQYFVKLIKEMWMKGIGRRGNVQNDN